MMLTRPAEILMMWVSGGVYPVFPTRNGPTYPALSAYVARAALDALVAFVALDTFVTYVARVALPALDA